MGVTPGILDCYPEYATTSRLDELRETEYGYLDEQDHLYLDYTGSGLAARAQHRAHEKRLATNVFGNPHSSNPTSEASTELVEKARARVLAHLNASSDEYAVIFTQNASAAARLIAESYPFGSGTRFVLTADNHNSINGIREFAARAGAKTVYIPVEAPELRADPAVVVKALKQRWSGLSCMGPSSETSRRSGLFAYPAQSNFAGVRHPLEWVDLAQKRGYDVLLDAAAYLPTAMLDLSAVKPDFVTVSWYKLFGYPTGVGCLIARRDALARLNRPWFSGGTVQAVAVRLPWHALATDETAFEDGTLNFLSIPDVVDGLDWLSSTDGAGGVPLVQTRVRCLTGYCLRRMLALRHSDGRPMVELYGPADTRMRGGTIAFNFLDASGRWVDERAVALESAAARISLRTGCFCNPGAAEAAFGLSTSRLPPMLRFARFLPRRHRPGSGKGYAGFNLDKVLCLIGMPAGGAIRVSFGAASTVQDVDRFIAFAEKTYKDRTVCVDGFPPRERCQL